MADGTKIEWTDATWNVINGCSVLSPGCTNCYAMKQAHRVECRRGLTKKTNGGMVWTGEVRFNAKVLRDPIRWRRPRKIFVCAHGDLFHDSVPDNWIDMVFAVMALCPQHTFQVLTKRAGRMRQYLGRPGVEVRIGLDALGLVMEAMSLNPKSQLGAGIKAKGSDINPGGLTNWPLPNVWIGTSVEDQTSADERIPDLLATPAAVRWLSCEPLLGPVDLRDVGGCHRTLDALNGFDSDPGVPGTKIDWIVAGGEGGPHARPMHPDWARSLRDQCAAAGTAFNFKQWGEFAPGEIAGEYLDPEKPAKGLSLFDGRWEECWSEVEGHCDDEPDVYRIGKKRAGRLLDGVEWNGYPA